jgi:hypothetical protein
VCKALEALRPDAQQEKTAKQTDVEKLRAKFPGVKVAPQLPPSWTRRGERPQAATGGRRSR